MHSRDDDEDDYNYPNQGIQYSDVLVDGVQVVADVLDATPSTAMPKGYYVASSNTSHPTVACGALGPGPDPILAVEY